MEYNNLINDLLDLLDNNIDVIKLKKLKKKLLNDLKFQEDLKNYHLTKTVANKKKLFENKDYTEYLKCENNLNILIVEIRNCFKEFNNRGCS